MCNNQRKFSREQYQAWSQTIVSMCDGQTTSAMISSELGCPQKFVQRVMKRLDLPRRPQGGPTGKLNGSFYAGRVITRDGYALVSAPAHPNARISRTKNIGRVSEHRLMMEKKLGRYLRREETVDHIDGLHLHNEPSNLRLFENNAAHLKETLAGRCPKWSEEGWAKLLACRHQQSGMTVVDTYDKKKKAGVIRQYHILLAACLFGIDNPFLLGTHRHLAKTGIVDLSHSNLTHELRSLCHEWGLNPDPLQ